MNVILSGRVGIGKTTVCRKILTLARKKGYRCGGILTPKITNGDAVTGIAIIDIQTREKETLASVESIYDGPRVGRYYFNSLGIEFGKKAIRNGASSDILLIDEIGYLELRGEGFAFVPALIQTGKLTSSILVIRQELLTDFKNQFNMALPVFEVNLNNRNGLPKRIYRFLMESEDE